MSARVKKQTSFREAQAHDPRNPRDTHIPKLDTRLEAEGAEFLVLGALLLERIPAYKTYTNVPGYDLVATNPDNLRSARIQVKSRWASGTSGFPIKNFDCEFVVFARLNRGNKSGTKTPTPPEFFIFPTSKLKALHRSEGWQKVKLQDLKDWQSYKDRWDLVRDFLDRRK